MAVNKTVIKSDLLALYNLAKITEMTEEEYAEEMSEIIGDAVLSAEIDETATTANGVTIGPSSVPVTGKVK